MARRSYTAEEKADALALYVEHGPGEASRRSAVPERTVRDWAANAGLTATASREKTQAATAAKLAQVEAKKAELAQRLMEDALKMRAEMWQPSIEKVVKTVGTGKGESETEVVEVHYDAMPTGQRKTTMTTIAIAVDKVLLLTGQATERTEHTITDNRETVFSGVDELTERRDRAS